MADSGRTVFGGGTTGGAGWAIGMAEVYSTPGTVKMLTGASLLRDAITYQAPYHPYGGGPGEGPTPVEAWCTIDATDPYKLNLSTGWYSITIVLRLEWDVETDAPDVLSLVMRGGWDINHSADENAFACAMTNTDRWGIDRIIDCGPTFISAGDGDQVFLEIRPRGSAPVADSLAGVLCWNITKHS